MFKASVITISDKGFRGEREDTAGPLAARLLKDAGYEVIALTIVPDEQLMIEAELRRHADELGANLILTSGGTGFSKRDVTPEATIAVCERMAPGIPEAMRAYCLNITNRAMLSRAQAGLYRDALIVNLPGSPKAVRENLEPVLPALEHGLQMLLGTKNECASEPKARV
ncbi:MAG: MogA/MoaB family molybdenum cofactor biosynthesis protein [Eubacteriales bacterium]|jgi:molybdenum cofactor synthesis domain-containing protein|nr:MogA/MoaB family molybdenum cofactor biosynthesis protein [Eubacteriales bacterium]